MKKTQNKGYCGVQCHSRSSRKPVCDFLLVISSNWHPIAYRFGVIAAYCSNFALIFGRSGLPPPIIFAPIVRLMNALQLCPWQFSHRCYSWGATSENRSKIGDFTPTRLLWSKISGTRKITIDSMILGQSKKCRYGIPSPPPIIFAQLVRPMNALQLCRWQFSHKETL